MIALDFTNELAPLIWTIEVLMLFAVGWLVAMFFMEQRRPYDFLSEENTASTPEPSQPDRHQPRALDDHRIAA